VVCNRQGTQVFVANIETDSIAAFNVDQNGMLSTVSGSPFRAGNGPLALAINRNGNILFASHQFSHSLGSYRIDGAGRLQLVSEAISLGTIDHGISLDTTNSRIYLADLGTNSVSGFRVDLNTGAASLLPNTPYFTDGDRPIDVLVHPSGRFVFASNNNNATITVFSVNGDGSLRAVSGSPFSSSGNGPAGMVMNAAGNLLFAINGGFIGSRDIGVYSFDTNTAQLRAIGAPVSLNTAGIPSAIGLIDVAAPPVIKNVTLGGKKRRLFIDGSGLSPSPRISINRKDVAAANIFTVTDQQIVLVGSTDELNLRTGDNRIVVTVKKQSSNAFIFKF
jgi:6-phosphogluconolactonase (cycloisomerase 2 family)